MSLYFEDFKIGDEWQTRARTITEADIVTFAGLTGDYTGLHVDAEEAAQTKFGQRIAHGALIFSYSVGLVTQMNLIKDTVVAFYGVDRLRFTGPTFIGDTIRVTKKVTSLEKKESGHRLVVYETKVTNQRGETVLVYSDKVSVRSRESVGG